MANSRWVALRSWLRDGSPGWIALGGIAIAVILGRAVADGIDSVRVAGTSLQLGAVCILALGLHELNRSFRQPSLLRRTGAWFRRLGACFSALKPTTGWGAATLRATAAGEGSAIRTLPADAPLPDRVALLEQQVAQMREEMDSAARRWCVQVAALSQRIELEGQQRRTEEQHIEQRIQEISIGGQHLEWVGVLWMFIGAAATGLPEKIIESVL